MATTKEAKTSKAIADNYNSVETALNNASTQIEDLRRRARASVDELNLVDEQRRRDNEQYEYNARIERQKVIDKQMADDKLRAEEHHRKTNELSAWQSSLALVLGVTGNYDPQTLRDAVQQKTHVAEQAGYGKGYNSAKAEFDTKKAIADAQDQTKYALLEEKNKQLQAENATLKGQNEKLLTEASRAVDKMSELAGKGFEAAGSIGTRGTSALETAATAANGGNYSRRS